MEASRRDATEEWLLPERSRPPLLSELEARIDAALATARSAEAAAIAIGAAALDAAEQARRSAELAERASNRFTAPPSQAARPPTAAPAPETAPPAETASPLETPPPRETAPMPPAHAPRADPSDGDPLSQFTTRADRLAERLRRLQRVPLATPR